MPKVYDFLLGENVGDTQRYRLRHVRDGLCRDCKRKAVQGGRCTEHHRCNILTSHAHYEARKRKAKII